MYKNTLATVKCQIQQAGNPTPAVVIGGEAAHIGNAILFDYLTSEVALEDPEIGSTDPNIRIDKIAWITNSLLGCQGAAGITKMQVTKATSSMPSKPPAGNDGP